MYELFRTVLIMSALGSGLTALLLILKPFTARKLPAKWQYYAWTGVLIFMLVPFWRMIPAERTDASRPGGGTAHVAETAPENAAAPPEQTAASEAAESVPAADPGAGSENTHGRTRARARTAPTAGELDRSIRVWTLACRIWSAGTCTFLAAMLISYAAYLCGKRKNAVSIEGSAVLESARSELGIKRKIRVRMSPDVKTPLLCGVLFPVIYIPCADIDEDKLRMVFLHELTHYKRKDLMIKWLSVFVNAVHWFDPLAYMLRANISESCEISCDMEVTKNMDEAEQKLYMKTILELV